MGLILTESTWVKVIFFYNAGIGIRTHWGHMSLELAPSKIPRNNPNRSLLCFDMYSQVPNNRPTPAY